MKYEGRIEKFMKFYSFFPHKFGPFSKLAYQDLNYLYQKGFLKENNKLTWNGVRETEKLDEKIVLKIHAIAGKFKDKDELIDKNCMCEACQTGIVDVLLTILKICDIIIGYVTFLDS